MNGTSNSFLRSYFRQTQYQSRITGAKCPGDNLNEFCYHINAMVEELGEVMKADKRWKTHRNTRYDHEEKVDELADVFITVMNLAIHSGITAEDVEIAISNKISENYSRLEKLED